MKKLTIVFFFVSFLFSSVKAQQTPANYDEHLQWWQDARFGLFIHWGPVTLTGD